MTSHEGLPRGVCISACVNLGHWEKAVGVFRFMRAAGVAPDVVSYNAVIGAYAEGRKWEKAVAMLEYMHEEGLEPSERTFNALIRCEVLPARSQHTPNVLTACEQRASSMRAACEQHANSVQRACEQGVCKI